KGRLAQKEIVGPPSVAAPTDRLSNTKATTMITIVGAGLGGLTLASVLYRNGITAVVYDADLSAAFRPQGGMLDIHEDTGQAALQAAGLLEAFGKLTLEHGDAMRILDKT